MLGGVFIPTVGPTLLRLALAGTMATPAVAAYVEMEFIGQGQGWTDVTADVADSDWRSDRGLPGVTAVDRFAKTGTWNFEMRNDAATSVGVIGGYSPDNVNCRPNFRVGIGVRLMAQVSGEFLPVFTGELEEIDPFPGAYDGRLTVPCTAVDWVNTAMQTPMGGLPTQLAKRSDQVFTSIVAIAPRPPRATQVMFGLDTYPYAGDTATDGQTMIAAELQRLTMSELGLGYVKADGTLVFENRKFRPTSVGVVDTFLDTELVDLAPQRGRKSIVTRVQTTVYPRKASDVATGVIFSLNTVTAIGPGETKSFGPAAYRDPSTNSATQIGAIDQQPPAATTDYTLNASQDGSGLDLTASATVTAAYSGNSVVFTVTNNSTRTGWITKLQCRGRALNAYGTIKADREDTTARDIYGQNMLQIDMAYQNDPAVGAEAAAYLLNLGKSPITQLPAATVFAHQNNPSLMARCLRREISDRIAIQETVSGLTKTYFINSIQTIFDGRLNLTWIVSLVPVDLTQYWLVEVVGRSELDQTTVLGYGLIVGHIDVAHADSHTDSAHGDVGHGDTNHVDDAHADQHNDSLHSDVAHQDSAHLDVSHADSHNDATHADVAHGDVAHGDSHADSGHIDSHADTTHQDSHDDTHTDQTHNDSAHTDVAHSDFHDDHDDLFSGSGDHTDTHGDVIHFDNAHGDVAHGDVAHTDGHGDVTHVDTHVDQAHGDATNNSSHSDTAHVDGAHADSHGDTSHSDTPHFDAAHTDGGHSDSHSDTAHADTVHSDSPHTDAAHTDTHGDTAHGDL